MALQTQSLANPTVTGFLGNGAVPSMIGTSDLNAITLAKGSVSAIDDVTPIIGGRTSREAGRAVSRWRGGAPTVLQDAAKHNCGQGSWH